jgi:glycosyltransferase involved in cell wall biosynthesis
MAGNKVVLMAVGNYCNPDNRVFRAANTIQKMGYQVILLAYWKNGLDETQVLGDGFILIRIKTRSIIKISDRFNNWQRSIYFKRKVLKYAQDNKPDIVHCHNYNTLFLGIYCKRKFKSKFIYDCHEYFQDLNYLHRYPVILRRIIAYFERRTITNHVDEMITVSPGIASLYQKYIKKPVSVIRNIPDLARVETDNSIPGEIYNYLNLQHIAGKKVLLYLGTNTQKGRGMDFTLRLLKELPETYSLVSFGAKSNEEIEYLKNKCNEMNLNNRFYPFSSLTSGQLKYIAKFCFIGLSLIEPILISYYYSLPNKLFEYITLGLPVLSSDIPEQKELINNFNVGLVVPFDIEIAKEKLLKYTPDLEMINKAQKELNWANEARKFISLGY